MKCLLCDKTGIYKSGTKNDEVFCNVHRKEAVKATIKHERELRSGFLHRKALAEQYAKGGGANMARGGGNVSRSDQKALKSAYRVIVPKKEP